MSIRRKTRNRILLLLSLAVVGTGALGGAYFVRRAILNASAMRDREAGMASVKAEDYAKGLQELGNYLARFANRPEAQESRYADALFNYALSRQMVEEPKRAHLMIAVPLWKRYLALPIVIRTQKSEAERVERNEVIIVDLPLLELREARHKLLDAQVGVGWLPEALDTASIILKTEPEHLKSLAVETQVLQQQRKYSEALIAAQAWAAAYPYDLEAHQMVVQLTGQLEPEKANNKYFVYYAEELLKTDPKEPRYALLASLATDQGADLKDRERPFRCSISESPGAAIGPSLGSIYSAG